MSSMWGNKVKISVFGGSHTEAIGVTIDGVPAGHKIDMDKVYLQMSRRAPGKDKAATPRLEADIPNVLSGILEGVTTGAPIACVINNSNTRSKDYSELKRKPRPGHSDYPAFIKYEGANDIRGGGHFSGRLTAAIVFAGSIIRQILEEKGIIIAAHAEKIAGICDEKFNPINPNTELMEKLNKEYFSVISDRSKKLMYDEIERARLDCDSRGGIIECAVTGVPAGLGEPMFGGVENVFSSILFGIPAIKAVEFGAGFKACDSFGSENNDEYYVDSNGDIKTYTNNSGGILGGITNGMPLVFRVGVKPTPSIAKSQNTVDLLEHSNAELIVNGRHDPCIVPRAIPVVEAAAAIALINIM